MSPSFSATCPALMYSRSGTCRPATCRSPRRPISSRAQGFYEKFPGRDVAVEQLSLKTPTDNSKGLRIGNFVQIRDVMDEELEAVWAGQKTPKQAFDMAVERGNKLLADFARATGNTSKGRPCVAARSVVLAP